MPSLDTIKFKCSHCDQSIEALAVMRGMTVQCPTCAAFIVAGLAESKPTPPALPESPSPVTSIRCPCLHCGQNLEFPADGLGTEIECPTCHQQTMLHRTVAQPTLDAAEIEEQIKALEVDQTKDKILNALAGPRIIAFLLAGLCTIVAVILNNCPKLQVANWDFRFSVAGLCLMGFALISPLMVKWAFDRGATAIEIRDRRSEANRKRDEELEFQRRIRENPFQCPKCESLDIVTYHPSKPVVFTPMSFTGILAGGIANAMANKIFTVERVCRNCGCRWPAPEYE